MSNIILKELPEPHPVFTDYYPSRIKNLYFTKKFNIANIEDNEKTDLIVTSTKSKYGKKILIVSASGFNYNALSLYIELFIETHNKKLKVELSNDNSINFNNFYYESQNVKRRSKEEYNESRKLNKELKLLKIKQEKEENKKLKNEQKNEILENLKNKKSFLIKNILTDEIFVAKNKKAIYDYIELSPNDKNILNITDDDVLMVKKYLVKKYTSSVEFPTYTDDQIEVFRIYDKEKILGIKTGYKCTNGDSSIIFAGSSSLARFLDCTQATVTTHAANNKPIKGYTIEKIL